MGTFPLTTAGAADWQTALYASPAAVVEQEAADAESNFKIWLNGRFELAADQEAYLDGIANDLTQHWGVSVAFFIRHRLPIELIKPEQTPVARSSKLVLSEEELKALEESLRASSGAFEGVLRFRITY